VAWRKYHQQRNGENGGGENISKSKAKERISKLGGMVKMA